MNLVLMIISNTLPIRWNHLLLWLFVWPNLACTQPTANERVPVFPDAFDYGSNMGYYPPHFTDKPLAALAKGVGVTSIRPGLFDYFLDQWGFDARLEHFRYYDSLGLRNALVISGFPADRNRDTTFFCPTERSRMFRNMYEPIWDNGENGTPVNDQNPYALYVWKAATTYRGLIKIWEVWNEPDVDTGNGWLAPGQPGNWWDNAPQPCETALKAPPYYYIRALRITYEVVKSIDPEAYVAVGGLGWPGFLDVVCRYTDNPENGAKSPAFPLTGGAYFDCMSFHTYPHLNNSLREWRNDINGFFYYRHSDAAVDGVWKHKNAFKTVLDKYGYDDGRFPHKLWICSEFNIPRKQFGEYIGSDEAQVNFLIKTLVTSQMEGMAQMHVYSLSDEKPEAMADSEFSCMGLFKNLVQTFPSEAKPNAEAYALQTTSQLLANSRYDPVRTMALMLPPAVRGAAFKQKDGQYTYVLWAKTTRDRDEIATETFRFPANLNLHLLEAKAWDFSKTGTTTMVQANHVMLTGSPVFLNAKSR